MPVVAAIEPPDRTLAALTHLSGLAGYLVPLGGVIVPIVIWIVKKEHPVIAALARQALLLNLVVFASALAAGVLLLTILLIPLVLLFWFALFLVALGLPIVGAIRALDGGYYRYPVVGTGPG